MVLIPCKLACSSYARRLVTAELRQQAVALHKYLTYSGHIVWEDGPMYTLDELTEALATGRAPGVRAV
jgi:hypothetical protein